MTVATFPASTSRSMACSPSRSKLTPEKPSSTRILRPRYVQENPGGEAGQGPAGRTCQRRSPLWVYRRPRAAWLAAPHAQNSPRKSHHQRKSGYSKRNVHLPQNQISATTTHKIGKTTYFVCASASEKATDTIDKKIKKLIRKDMEQNAGSVQK